MRHPAPDRFWANVDTTGDCWLWTGASKVGGYGVLYLNGGRQIRAHRLSWVFANGPIPKGLAVLHRCDVRACVNPAHLFLGTWADNAADAAAKGRMTRGETKPGARLKEADVHEVRRLLDLGVTAVRIAAQYGVRPSTIRSIRNGESWTWLQPKAA